MKKSFEKKGIPWSQGESLDLLRNFMPFQNLEYANAFTVTILDKSKFADSGRRTTLPNFFFAFSEGITGGNVDKLVAEQNSILAGTSLLLKRVKVDGKETDAQLDRWLLFTENESKFYLGEITYSPQTQAPIQVWEDLRAFMQSFRIVESKSS